MASLENATKNAKKAAIIILVMFFACSLWGLINMNGGGGNVTVVDTESRIFNDLPQFEPTAIKFEYPDDVIFEINTVNGRLPSDMPSIVNVYQFYQPIQGLNSKKQAISLASQLGFFKSPVVEENRYYKWTSLTGTKILEYDSLTRHFHLETDLKKDPVVRRSYEVSPNIEGYKKSFLSFVSTISPKAIPKDYTELDATAEYLVYLNGEFVSGIEASSQADFIEVNAYRKILSRPLGSKEAEEELVGQSNAYVNIVNENPFKGNIRGIFAGGKLSENSIVELDVYINQINYSVAGQYRIISVEEAYNKLTKKEGKLVYIGDYSQNKDKNVAKFSINSVKLGYYEEKDYSIYLQPIYIFSGIVTFEDNSRADFNFYLPAIRTI